MPIFQTGAYRVKPAAVNKVKEAIKELVQYVRTSEPGTQMYLTWQHKGDPTHFIHLFIFADEAAHRRHGESEAVKRFESIYSPELVGGNVVFTDYEMIALESDNEPPGGLRTSLVPPVGEPSKSVKADAGSVDFIGLIPRF